jgi:hypothetical protein
MTKRTRARRLLFLVLVPLGALVVLSVSGLLARHALASFFAGRVLTQKGFDCAPISVRVALGIPPQLELAATRCKVAEGPLESIEFKEPLSIKLDGLKIGSLECALFEIDLRPSAHKEVELNTLGDLSRIVGLDQPALELMFDAAELSSAQNPPLLATRAVVRRAGKQVSSFQDLEVTSSAEGMTITSPATRLDQGALLGAGALRLTATPTAVTLTVAFAGDLKVKIVLDHVDATRPSADFNISIGEPKGPPGE